MNIKNYIINVLLVMIGVTLIWWSRDLVTGTEDTFRITLGILSVLTGVVAITHFGMRAVKDD